MLTIPKIHRFSWSDRSPHHHPLGPGRKWHAECTALAFVGAADGRSVSVETCLTMAWHCPLVNEKIAIEMAMCSKLSIVFP